MKSLTELSSGYKCHQDFYRMAWGDLTCKECGKKGLLFREKYEYCPHHLPASHDPAWLQMESL